MHSTPRLTRLRARTRALIAVALVALLLMQSLGVLHRFAHRNAGASQGVEAARAAERHPDQEEKGWLAALFSGHPQDVGCELYDQLSHADLLCGVPALALPNLAVASPAERHAAWHLAAQSAGFLARGPPV